MRPSILMLHGFSAHKDIWLTVVKVRGFYLFIYLLTYLSRLELITAIFFTWVEMKHLFSSVKLLLFCWSSIYQSICTLYVWTCQVMKEQHAPTQMIILFRGRSKGYIRYPGHCSMKCGSRLSDTSMIPPNTKCFFVCCSSQFVETIRFNRKPFHLVGTSMGGNVAGVYAAYYPSEICSMTLICPDGQCVCVIPKVRHKPEYYVGSGAGGIFEI